MADDQDRDKRGTRLALQEAQALLDDCVDALARGSHHARGAQLPSLASDLAVLRTAVERELGTVRDVTERHVSALR